MGRSVSDFLKEGEGPGHEGQEAPAGEVRAHVEQPEKPSEDGLVARLRAGEAAAWKPFYEAHFDFVYRIARRFGTPPGEADDVVQETFTVAFRKLDTFRDGEVRTWLYRIAANVSSGRSRRRRVQGIVRAVIGGEPEATSPAADRRHDAMEAHEQVSEVLARMSAKKREVFALYELEGLSGEEIAERLGCKVDTVWSRLHYARQDFERIGRKRGIIQDPGEE
jgi:RNA polymerase sigma-70 factor (ECF subfamily)